MNSKQFTFDFPESISFASADFILSSANKKPLEYINNWQNWGAGKYSKILLLHGPKNSGKTHLCHIFSYNTGANFLSIQNLFTRSIFEIIKGKKFLILEDIDTLKDCAQLLFHLINEVVDHEVYLLMSSKISPIDLDFKLEDLNSRIRALPSVKINQPDDKLIRTVLIKRFSDKQIRVSREIIDYLINRIDRSFSDIKRLVDYIDQKSIIEKRKVNLSLVKEILEYIQNLKN